MYSCFACTHGLNVCLGSAATLYRNYLLEKMGSQRAALKDAITQILSCALQPESDIQRLTEERKKALEMTEDYPFILLEIIQGPDEAYAEKLMAATFLKNYITDVYKSKELVSIKPNLTEKLVLGLVEALSQSDGAITPMISSSLELLIVNEFPNLFSIINNKIMSFLLSENLMQIRGAIIFMKGLESNHRTFCTTQMYFQPEYIEPLLNILHNEAVSMELRATTVPCMVQILIKSENSPLFAATYSRLTEVFHTLLNEPYSPLNDFRLRSEIIIEISRIVVSLPERALDLVQHCLPAIGRIMFNCCMESKEIIIGHKQTPRDIYEDEPKHFSQLIMNILILINNLFVLPNYSALLTDSLNDFMYLLFILMCVYDENALFTEETMENTPETDYSIRGRCGHTLMIFMDQCDFEKFSSAFHHVIQKHLQEANLIRTDSETYYFRILEALMFGVGLLNYIYEVPLESFCCYVEIWSSLLLEQPHWVVLGRLMWLGSKFSVALAPVTLSNHLNAILANYNTQNESLKIACYDSIRGHLVSLKLNPNKIVFSNVINQVMECLFSISLYSSVMATVSLQSLAQLCEFCPQTTARHSQRLTHTILESIVNHVSNSAVIKEVKYLLSKILVNPDCKEIINNTLIPFTMKLIYKNCAPPLNTKIDVPERGFDLLNTIIKFYPGNMEDNVILQSFCAACNSILEFDDSSIMEVATIFISNMLMKTPYQIKTLRDIKGKVLAAYVPDVLFKLLQPYPQEAVCPSKFGRLCVISIMTLPEHIQPFIESILKGLLSALQRTNCEEPLKSYCFIFAYMFTWQTENIIRFLSGIPGPDGDSALSYFLNKWQISMLNCERFEKSIITIAICKMIEYSLTKNDKRISECRINLEPPYGGECTGLEKLYLCLVKIFLSEIQIGDKNFKEEDETLNDDDVLIKNHPVCNLDLVSHIKTFLRNFNTIHYYNVVKNYVQKSDENFMELEKHGIKPNNLNSVARI